MSDAKKAPDGGKVQSKKTRVVVSVDTSLKLTVVAEAKKHNVEPKEFVNAAVLTLMAMKPEIADKIILSVVSNGLFAAFRDIQDLLTISEHGLFLDE